MATMKAILLTKAPQDEKPTVTYSSVPKPTIKPGHLLIKVAASLYNPSDRLNANGGFSHEWPRLGGRDFSGIVVDGPPARIGEHVFGTGGGVLGMALDGPHADFVLVPEVMAVRKPATISHVQAAGIGVPFTTAHLAIQRARVTAADSVLVIGSTGNVGSAAIQILRALGCSQVYTAARRDTADVNLVSDPTLSGFKEKTGGKGVNVVIDTVGDTDLLKASFNALAKRGRCSFIASGGTSNAFEFVVRPFYRNEFELIGCNTGLQTPEEVGESLAVLGPWFEQGKLTPNTPMEKDLVSIEDVVHDYQTGTPGRTIVVSKQDL